MPGFSRISLSSVSCSYSPNRRSGPLLRERGLTSPVSSNIFKYRLTVRSETLICWPISCGEACQARAIQIIRHRKSREHGIGMTNRGRYFCYLDLPGQIIWVKVQATCAHAYSVLDNKPENFGTRNFKSADLQICTCTCALQIKFKFDSEMI